MRLYEQIDDNGNTTYVDKAHAVYNAIFDDLLATLNFEKQTNEKRQKPLFKVYITRIKSRVLLELLKLEKPMPNAEALNLDGKEFYDYYINYCEFCCMIEGKCKITYNQDKPEFCAFLGITTTAFEEIRINGNTSQKEALEDIDTRIANSIATSAENSEIASKSATFRLSAKSGIGHKIQTADNKDINIIAPITENSFTALPELQPIRLPKNVKTDKKRKTDD